MSMSLNNAISSMSNAISNATSTVATYLRDHQPGGTITTFFVLNSLWSFSTLITKHPQTTRLQGNVVPLYPQKNILIATVYATFNAIIGLRTFPVVSSLLDSIGLRHPQVTQLPPRFQQCMIGEQEHGLPTCLQKTYEKIPERRGREWSQIVSYNVQSFFSTGITTITSVYVGSYVARFPANAIRFVWKNVNAVRAQDVSYHLQHKTTRLALYFLGFTTYLFLAARHYGLEAAR
jgi:hypothetical protein